MNPEKEDLGLYSVAVTDTEGVSSSYTLKEEGMSQRSNSMVSVKIFFHSKFLKCHLKQMYSLLFSTE